MSQGITTAHAQALTDVIETVAGEGGTVNHVTLHPATVTAYLRTCTGRVLWSMEDEAP